MREKQQPYDRWTCAFLIVWI